MKLKIEYVEFLTFHTTGGLSTNDGGTGEFYFPTCTTFDFAPICPKNEEDLQVFEEIGRFLSRDGYLEDTFDQTGDWRFIPNELNR